jgi:hypothetical protein
VTKLLSWGHWLVGAYFTVLGADALWYAAAIIPNDLREHPKEVTYLFIDHALTCAILLVCAWGIFKWRRWAYGLAIGISLLECFGAALVISVFGVKPSGAWLRIGNFNFGLSAAVVVSLLLAFLVLGWLMLPPVRHKYWQKTATA